MILQARMARARARLKGLVLALLLAGCMQPAERVAGPDMAVILGEDPAPKLADYGLFLDIGATQPVARLVPYELINPLFSDHASKTRLVFVPEGALGQYEETDALSLPVGSVLVKSFGYAETGRIETRLLIHKSSGWVGYPYVWNEDHTEARYAPIGAKRDIEITSPTGEVLSFQYSVPNQNQCKTCHQAGDLMTPIGPKARNLGADQLAAWTEAGLLAGTPQSISQMPSIANTQNALNARARAYLDINCAHCHKSDGAASNSGLWLGWEESRFVKLGIGKHPTAAGRGAGQLDRIIEPGEPDQSILSFRMASAEAGIAMPELGRRLVDREGVDLINQWIEELRND